MRVPTRSHVSKQTTKLNMHGIFVSYTAKIVGKGSLEINQLVTGRL
jgi:hypothetical protein